MRDPDERSTWDVMTSTRIVGFWVSRSRRTQTALMLLPVVIIAALLRLPGVISDPPGFRHEEATAALAAQQIERGFFPIYFTDGNDALEPVFVYAVNLTGQLAGWGVTGPRLAAALFGIMATIACALWYRQTLGDGWGLVGGILVATSFWQVVYSRQAVPAIAMAAVGALGLLALYQAIEAGRLRGRQAPSGWYGLAGLAFGLGIYTDATMRAVVPVVIVIGVFLLIKKGYLWPSADRGGLLLGFTIMVLVVAPLASYVWQNPDAFLQGIENVKGDRGLVESVTNTFDTLARSGDGDPTHTLPGRAVIDPILLVWAVIGLGVALRRPLEAVNAVALIWFAGFLIAIVAIAPGDQGQMLVLTPALFYFPLLGMRASLQATRKRGLRTFNIVVAIVVLSVAGSATWSVYDYVWQWSNDVETYRAFQGDVRDALDEIDRLPNDNLTVYFSTGKQGRIVRYLAPDRPRRDFDNPATLPMPDTGAAYLVAPVSATIDESMAVYLGDESLIATGTDPDGELAYRMWFVDTRTRERLPYAVPAIFFEDGPSLLGFEVTPLLTGDDPSINLILVYRVAAGSESFWSLARLVELDGDTDGLTGQIVQPAPDHAIEGNEIILIRIALPFPDTPGMVADLHTAARTPAGEYLIPYGPNVIVIDDYFALLNAIGYIGPEP